MVRARRRFLVYVSLIVLGTLTSFEGLAFLAGVVLRARGVFYAAQPLAGFERYREMRDPVLGWPAPASFGHGELDPSGSRVVPAFPEPGHACVSLYGDSFTFGDGVSSEDAWGNVLSRRLGCRVANYGTPGYGTDQAVLRFERNTGDEAPVVVLTHLTENIARNLSQLRGLMYAGTPWGLKPRFVLDRDDGLRLVPLGDLDRDAFAALVAKPERYLEYDPFAPGRAAGVSRLSFPYTASLVRALNHVHVRAALARRPWYAEFYDPQDPGQGVEVTARIIARMHRDAAARGKVALSLVLPTGIDLTYHRATGRWVHDPLMQRLAELGVPTLDLAPVLVERLGNRNPCEIFVVCDGHLDDEGNALLAEIVEHELLAQRPVRAALPAAVPVEPAS